MIIEPKSNKFHFILVRPSDWPWVYNKLKSPPCRDGSSRFFSSRAFQKQSSSLYEPAGENEPKYCIEYKTPNLCLFLDVFVEFWRALCSAFRASSLVAFAIRAGPGSTHPYRGVCIWPSYEVSCAVCGVENCLIEQWALVCRLAVAGVDGENPFLQSFPDCQVEF